MVYNTELEKKAIAEEAQILSVMPPSRKIINLNINKIRYFSSKGNKVYIYTTNDKQHEQYISLSDIENIIPKSLYIKANRSHVVMLNSIARYDDQALYVKPDNLPIPFYTTKKQEIKDKLYE